jgi:predicted outer membrane repeat protein
MNQSRDIPIQTRLASFQPATIDREARTIELVWTTGARVRRTDWWTGKRYDEELSLDPAHVDLARLNNGAPLLDSHNGYGLSNQIGVVERAWLEGDEGRAIVRFSTRADVAPYIADIEAGIIRNVSVGYSVRKYQIEEGDIPLYRAVDWEPMELSMVPIPADAGAGTRSATQTNTCEFVTARAAAQPQTQDQEQPTMPETVDIEAARSEAAAQAVEAERCRIAEISRLCERHQLPELRETLVTEGRSVDQAMAAVLEALAARDAEGTRPRAPRIEGGRDETETRRSAVENALLHRAQPGRFTLDEHGREYRGLSLLEIARDLLERAGAHTRGMDKMAIAQRAMHSTSDFPAILANVANKTLRAAYEAAPQTFKPFTKQATAPDFKQIQRTAAGDAPTLVKVNENGEFTYGSIGEGKETYQLATYGRIIAITRQTIINDDLGAFTDIPAKFGRAAADLESDIVWGILTANAAMSDGVALFHANHANLAGSGGAISVTTLSAARAAMRLQKSIDGRLINVTPAYLLVPAAIETVAQQYTSADFVSAKSSDINPFKSTLQVVAEPRLDANSTTAWYLAADPMQIDTIEYCYLDGQQGVYIETRNGFEVDGMEIKARLDFAAKSIDYRGLYKNAGA